MSLSDFSAAGAGEPWATTSQNDVPEPSVESALEKEKLIKDIITLRDGLRGLLVRVTETEAENEKLAKDNEMLSVYIDNLTRNSVVAAGTKR
ncbi:hypothetical protein I317_01297 [Kwoniella heveanensis CBS 569]|uniref:Short coiled-coil protein n=1 Tax=Kwoniella heveanensis BCC8398 TaxID=1296120 RepID=A0A1B9GSH2_9TREE|nr:hypothetical protein I316_04517 [Kwoniella heveanensis BCC8398]OCF44808.1 hypothetical protein I317_01297 [Kwoniella heveanensis CBS 569]